MSSENYKKSQNREKEARIQIVLIIVAVLVAIAVALIVVNGKKKTDVADEVAATEQVYTPTFMYFVTQEDENYDEYMAVLADVQEEYADVVNFTITDINEESDIMDRFGDIIALGTPSLIMLNTKNDPCAFEGKCVTREQMVESIEKALQAE